MLLRLVSILFVQVKSTHQKWKRQKLCNFSFLLFFLLAFRSVSWYNLYSCCHRREWRAAICGDGGQKEWEKKWRKEGNGTEPSTTKSENVIENRIFRITKLTQNDWVTHWISPLKLLSFLFFFAFYSFTADTRQLENMLVDSLLCFFSFFFGFYFSRLNFFTALRDTFIFFRIFSGTFQLSLVIS